jgi:hypothetical protein
MKIEKNLKNKQTQITMNISLSLIIQQILMTLSNFYTFSIFNDAPQP